MKLIYPELDIVLELMENQVWVMTVEHIPSFSKMVESIWRQTQGESGSFLLVEKEKELRLDKEAECIVNPFAIDFSEKKIVTELTKELTAIGEEKYPEEYASVRAEAIGFLDRLVSEVPYPLDFEYNQDLGAFLKGYGIKVVSEADNLVNRIIEYIRVKNQLCHTHIFVLVNIKQYLRQEEIEELYLFAGYQKVYLVLLESMKCLHFPEERCIVIDKDMCILQLD